MHADIAVLNLLEYLPEKYKFKPHWKVVKIPKLSLQGFKNGCLPQIPNIYYI